MENKNIQIAFLIVILFIGVLVGVNSTKIDGKDQAGLAVSATTTSSKINEDPAGKPYCKWDDDGGLWFCTCANHHIGPITWGGWHSPESPFEWRACSAKAPY